MAKTSSRALSANRFEIAFHALLGSFWGVWGILPPNEFQYCRNPQKDRPWAKTRRTSHKSWKSVHGFDLGACPRKYTV